MSYILTGGTGHIGNNVARALEAAGLPARLLARRENDRALQGVHLPVTVGDICSYRFLCDNISAGDIVIHSAGMIAVTEKHAAEVYRVNTDSAANIAEACLEKGARLVYVSSVDAMTRDSMCEPVDFYPERLTGCYAKSKALASAYILKQARTRGLDAVIVCPSAVVGINDFKISCVGQVISDYLNRLPMARVSGGYNFVNVRDVANGILLAAKRGQAGKCYLLSGEYMSVDQLFATLNELTGKKSLPLKLPISFVKTFAGLGSLYFTLRHKNPVFSPYALDTLNSPCNYDCTATCREIGYTYGSAREAVLESGRWLLEYNGRKS